MLVLQPSQFTVNEAWIVFRINDVPIETDADGAFNCMALMDAASCFILGSEFVPLNADELSELEIYRLLKQGQNHKNQLPKTLYVPVEQSADLIIAIATRQGIHVVVVPESELNVFIGEARDDFRERFGRSEA